MNTEPNEYQKGVVDTLEMAMEAAKNSGDLNELLKFLTNYLDVFSETIATKQTIKKA